MFEYYLSASIGVIFTAAAQVLLKIGANKTKNKKLITKYINVYVITGYIVFLGVTLLNLYAYQYLPLKMTVVFLPFTFLLVGLFSFGILKEEFNRKQLISSVIIVVGVVVYNL